MAERLLNDQIVSQIKDAFAALEQPVEMIYFGEKEGCQYCDETLQLAQELADISEHLSLSVYDLAEHAETAAKYNVDKAPGLVIAGRDGEQVVDYGIRYAGIPSGHEFSSLIQDVLQVSSRDSGLDPDTRTFLAGLTEPVLLQVFVTPT